MWRGRGAVDNRWGTVGRCWPVDPGRAPAAPARSSDSLTRLRPGVLQAGPRMVTADGRAPARRRRYPTANRKGGWSAEVGGVAARHPRRARLLTPRMQRAPAPCRPPAL
jgi:hypothetical protein